MNVQTFENHPRDSRISAAGVYNLVNAGKPVSAEVAGSFRENRPHISQGHSALRENLPSMKKAPPGWHRTRPDQIALEVRHG